MQRPAGFYSAQNDLRTCAIADYFTYEYVGPMLDPGLAAIKHHAMISYGPLNFLCNHNAVNQIAQEVVYELERRLGFDSPTLTDCLTPARMRGGAQTSITSTFARVAPPPPASTRSAGPILGPQGASTTPLPCNVSPPAAPAIGTVGVDKPRASTSSLPMKDQNSEKQNKNEKKNENKNEKENKQEMEKSTEKETGQPTKKKKKVENKEKEKKKEKDKEKKVDRISSLPLNVLHLIFDNASSVSRVHLSHVSAPFCRRFFNRPSPWLSPINASTVPPPGLIHIATKNFFFDPSLPGLPRDSDGNLLFNPEMTWKPAEKRKAGEAVDELENDRAAATETALDRKEKMKANYKSVAGQGRKTSSAIGKSYDTKVFANEHESLYVCVRECLTESEVAELGVEQKLCLTPFADLAQHTQHKTSVLGQVVKFKKLNDKHPDRKCSCSNLLCQSASKKQKEHKTHEQRSAATRESLFALLKSRCAEYDIDVPTEDDFLAMTPDERENWSYTLYIETVASSLKHGLWSRNGAGRTAEQTKDIKKLMAKREEEDDEVWLGAKAVKKVAKGRGRKDGKGKGKKLNTDDDEELEEAKVEDVDDEVDSEEEQPSKKKRKIATKG